MDTTPNPYDEQVDNLTTQLAQEQAALSQNYASLDAYRESAQVHWTQYESGGYTDLSQYGDWQADEAHIRALKDEIQQRETRIAELQGLLATARVNQQAITNAAADAIRAGMDPQTAYENAIAYVQSQENRARLIKAVVIGGAAILGVVLFVYLFRTLKKKK